MSFRQGCRFFGSESYYLYQKGIRFGTANSCEKVICFGTEMNNWMDNQIENWMNNWMDKWMDNWVNILMDNWMDNWMNNWMDHWMENWKDKWMDKTAQAKQHGT